MRILVTGAAGTAGQAVCKLLAEENIVPIMADVMPPPADVLACGEFVRCDTRTPDDVRQAVSGADAVIHLAAWHCAHVPPVSDSTIFAVNVDGTYNVLHASREAGIKALVFASSMAYGWGSVYGVTKVLGEDLCRMYHETARASVVMLRYHDFVPKPYLAFGTKLLRNGVDRRDVAAATVASVKAALEGRVQRLMTIVHTDHHMPREVVEDFARLGIDWCEEQVPGARQLIEKYQLSLPDRVEQHDLSQAKQLTGWEPRVGFVEFLQDLKARDVRGEDVTALWAPGQLPE